jgi:hypothetical protein
MFLGLMQMLMALVGAALISAGVMGFEAEWHALFKRPLGGVSTRILVHGLSAMFQLYNGYMHDVPEWEIVVLALLTGFAATGFIHLVKKRSA